MKGGNTARYLAPGGRFLSNYRVKMSLRRVRTGDLRMSQLSKLRIFKVADCE